MCGIAYFKSFEQKNVNKTIRKTYYEQKDRGQWGFGFVAIGDSIVVQRAVHEHEIMSALKKTRSSEIIFHHRFPTSTDNTVNTAHPIFGKGKNGKMYYMVHNGVISNASLLKPEHEKEGIVYSTILENQFNDSEALFWELVQCLDGTKKLKDFKAMGSIAFILLQTGLDGKPEKLYFSRNYGSPLKIQHKKGKVLALSSEGEGADIETDILFVYSYKTGKIKEKTFIMDEGLYGRSVYVPYDDDWGTYRYSPHDGVEETLDEAMERELTREELGLMTEKELEVLWDELVSYRTHLVDELAYLQQGTDVTEQYDVEWMIEVAEKNIDKISRQIQQKYNLY